MNILSRKNYFSRAAFKSDSQNCLRDHDFELITRFYTDKIEKKSGQKLSEHLHFLLEMYCQGSVYMTIQWVLGRKKTTPRELAKALTEAVPAELKAVFEKLQMI